MFKPENPILGVLVTVLQQIPYIAFIFLLPAAVSAVESLRKRELLDRQTSIDSIRSLSWKEFEELVAEAYRRQGYFVTENAHSGPDGGIDLKLQKNGALHLVQCKQWRAYKVGVPIIREMLGLITAHRATGGIVVTCGRFTQEAKTFAAQNGIELIEETQLAELVKGVQSKPIYSVVEKVPPPEETAPVAKICPKCGATLVQR